MIKELKTYYCDLIPTAEDLQECIRIARTHKCIVLLKWDVLNTIYSIRIYSTDSLSDVQDKMPKEYLS